MKTTKLAFVCALVASVGTSIPCTAGEADEKSAGEERGEAGRTTGGHAFLPSFSVPDPFTNATVRLTIGYMVANSKAPSIDLLGNETGSRHYQQAGLSQSLAGQFPVLPWVAIHVGAEGLLYTGTTARSAVAFGPTLAYGGTLGAKASVLVGGNIQVGALFDVEYAPSYEVKFLSALRDSISAQSIQTRDLVVDRKTTTLRPGVSVALALGRALGLVAAGQFAHPTVDGPRPETGGNAFLAGGSVDLDLHPISPIPFALVAAYRAEMPVAGERREARHTADLGLYFSGRRDLAFGPTVSLRRFPQGQNARTEAAIGMFSMQYFW